MVELNDYILEKLKLDKDIIISYDYKKALSIMKDLLEISENSDLYDTIYNWLKDNKITSLKILSDLSYCDYYLKSSNKKITSIISGSESEKLMHEYSSIGKEVFDNGYVFMYMTKDAFAIKRRHGNIFFIEA